MKLEEKFIRTYDGNIAQINILDKENNPLIICSIKGKGYMVSDIKKASHNIIDLIEVGDIVYVEEADDYACEFFRDIYMIKNEDNLLNIINLINKPNVRLLSILTKEQFENNCYKIGD